MKKKEKEFRNSNSMIRDIIGNQEATESAMCDYCSQVKLVKNFRTPHEYEKTIKYIKELIEKDGFLFVEGTCTIGEHKKNGHWIDDIIFHTIECPNCGQAFTCAVNTYRGGGSFRKGR